MSAAHDGLLSYYAAPGVFTGVEGFETDVDAVPNDIAGIVRAAQGLLINHAMAPAYGAVLKPERVAVEKELHAATAMLARAKQLDARPISERREPGQRVAVVCRHFATLFVAFARHKGIPSRVRAGFANYFEKGKHTEHWVGEYWRPDEGRWVLVDAQVDGPQRAFFKPDFDTLDVPRDRFLVAGDSWRVCREGADAMTFGVAGTAMWGLVEVFGEIFQDLAALQKIELLPWGWYGMAKEEQRALDAERELVDRLATLSSAADEGAIETLRAMVAGDERLRVPVGSMEAGVAADEAALGTV